MMKLYLSMLLMQLNCQTTNTTPHNEAALENATNVAETKTTNTAPQNEAALEYATDVAEFKDY